MSTADPTAGASRRSVNLAGIQKFGRSLMLPIAALPVAAGCFVLRAVAVPAVRSQRDLLHEDLAGWCLHGAWLQALSHGQSVWCDGRLGSA